MALMSVGSAAIVYGLSELGGATTSFTAPQVLWPIIAGVAMVAVFIWHALRIERPLLDVRLYKNACSPPRPSRRSRSAPLCSAR